jgi:hypothetical protein
MGHRITSPLGSVPAVDLVPGGPYTLLVMAESDNKRLQEGALSALKTPANPPATPKLVPLKRPASSNGAKRK